MSPDSASSAYEAPIRQLIFRAKFTRPIAHEASDVFEFVVLDRIVLFISWFRRIALTCGVVEALKGCVRILRGRQFFYAVHERNRIVHYGWVTFGRCRQYKIESDACVIGPIWSSPAARGKGAATLATKGAIDEIVRRGTTTIYIDTAENNLPCLRVIEKCGFGQSFSSYDRCD